MWVSSWAQASFENPCCHHELFYLKVFTQINSEKNLLECFWLFANLPCLGYDPQTINEYCDPSDRLLAGQGGDAYACLSSVSVQM